MTQFIIIVGTLIPILFLIILCVVGYFWWYKKKVENIKQIEKLGSINDDIIDNEKSDINKNETKQSTTTTR